MCSDQSGVWLLPEDAAKHLDVLFNNERQFKKDSTRDVSRHFERGDSCSSTNSFSSFVYVCVLKGALLGWKASANFRLNLAEFINMCNHLSENKNFLSTDSVISKNFQTYTGMVANPYNIRIVFDSGVLYSSRYLEEKLANVSTS